MSQSCVLFRELRAVFTVATVCALIFGLLFANFAQASSGPAATGVAKAGAYALCVQHLTRQAPDKRAAPMDRGESHSGKCPGCCLAVTLASALLPERDVAPATPRVAPPLRIAFIAASPRAPGLSLLRAAHGARAPPA